MNVNIYLPEAFKGETPKFKWKNKTQSGEAHIASITYGGGKVCWVSGPTINRDGEIGSVNRHELVQLDDLDNDTLLLIEKAVHENMESLRKALGYVNTALLEKMQADGTR